MIYDAMVGGTEIEPWTNLEGFCAVPSLAPWAEQVQCITPLDEVNAQTPSAIYNAMIHPLAPFALAGFTWCKFAIHSQVRLIVP